MGAQSSKSPVPSSEVLALMKLLWPVAIAVQAMHVAAKLGVAELLASGPMSLDALADATQTNSNALGRLMRCLASLGIFRKDEAGNLHNTAASEVLRRDYPSSVLSWSLLLGAPGLWGSLGDLEQVVRTGKASFQSAHGSSFYEYLAAHPGEGAAFHNVMSSNAKVIASAIMAAYDFSRFHKIVDVGAGHGKILKEILRSNTCLRGVLFDLPKVVAAISSLELEEVAGRCEIASGNCLESVPVGGDLYFIKNVIADSNDSDGIKILENCRRALVPEGKLLILDTIYTPATRPEETFMDVLMMTALEGRDRTEDDYRVLLQRAGFSISRVITLPWFSILECGLHEPQ